ncbi:MAG: 50S ribosomal protein L21e [Candidatus Thermoplasmatota archaeon]|jgi:large subunit ribosomal protein L21e|nr:50S ribosomal protein L21e [Candidatus Thermoplasmatota archaeon]
MVKRSKGIMANTRQTLKKKPSERGMPPITDYLKHFEIGEKANIVIESSSQKGQPHRRFQGLVGTIVERRGRAYVVRVQLPRSYKDVIARPEHLKRVG